MQTTDAINTEIERRWLLHAIPADWLAAARPQPIRQGYLIAEEQRCLRVREKAGAYTMTIKTGTGLARHEQERPINADLFEMLWPLTTPLRIEKTRHTLQRDGHCFEIDIFEGALAPLKLLEVEFASEAEARAFRPPDFVGRELTHDGRFTNAALSRHGLPADWARD